MSELLKVLNYCRQNEAVDWFQLKGHGFGSELLLSSETDRLHSISEHLIHQTLSMGWETEVYASRNPKFRGGAVALDNVQNLSISRLVLVLAGISQRK